MHLFFLTIPKPLKQHPNLKKIIHSAPFRDLGEKLPDPSNNYDTASLFSILFMGCGYPWKVYLTLRAQVNIRSDEDPGPLRRKQQDYGVNPQQNFDIRIRIEMTHSTLYPKAGVMRRDFPVYCGESQG